MDAATHFSLAEAARVLKVNESRVRTLVRVGGLDPGAAGEPRFTFQQLLMLRTTHGLLESGVPERRVRKVWSSLEGRSLADVQVQAEGETAVVTDGEATWEPDSGQVVLDFSTAPLVDEPSDITVEAPPTSEANEGAEVADPRALAAPRPRLTLITSVVPERPAPRVRTEPDADFTAEEWFQLANELEGSSAAEARDAYLRAIAADPAFAEAHLNLGRLDHEAGELGRAEAHYRDAVRHAPDDATPHYNLGVLLEDRGRPDEAVFAYKQAITREPGYADAHYNLGLLLESRGRRAEAMKHLMIAREIYDRASGAR